MKKCIKYFALFAIIGFIIESIYAVIENINYNSGFLYGPWTPIYGFGILIILILNNFVKVKGILKYIYFFLLSAFFITIIEIVGGYFIEFIFGVKFWGYSKHAFGIGHYASLEMAVVWGSGACLLNYGIFPFVDKLIKKIPFSLSLTIIILMLFDFIFTLIYGIYR